MTFSFYTADAEASGSGSGCNFCMDISSVHWDQQYNRWDCPKLFCGEGGEYWVGAVLNGKSKCRKVYLSKVKQLCDKHAKCKECGKEGKARHYDKIIVISECKECKEEISRSTIKKVRNSSTSCSIEYRTKREDTCEACVKCPHCPYKIWHKMHTHHTETKYACCTKSTGKTPNNQRGPCWQTQTKNKWYEFCGECPCPLDAGQLLKFMNKKLKIKACSGKLGFGGHWVHAIHAKHCSNCERTSLTKTSQLKFTIPSCTIMPWIPSYVDSCGFCEK